VLLSICCCCALPIHAASPHRQLHQHQHQHLLCIKAVHWSGWLSNLGKLRAGQNGLANGTCWCGDLQQEARHVLAGRALETHGCKMWQRLLQWPMIQHLAASQQQQIVEEVEDLRRRLQQADDGSQIQSMRHLHHMRSHRSSCVNGTSATVANMVSMSCTGCKLLKQQSMDGVEQNRPRSGT